MSIKKGYACPLDNHPLNPQKDKKIKITSYDCAGCGLSVPANEVLNKKYLNNLAKTYEKVVIPF